MFALCLAVQCTSNFVAYLNIQPHKHNLAFPLDKDAVWSFTVRFLAVYFINLGALCFFLGNFKFPNEKITSLDIFSTYVSSKRKFCVYRRMNCIFFRNLILLKIIFLERPRNFFLRYFINQVLQQYDNKV